MQCNPASEVTLEIPWRDSAGGDRIRRVQVCLGEPFDLASTGERRRRLRMVTDGAVESTGLVEANVSWGAVLAQAEMLLAFQDENRGEASS